MSETKNLQQFVKIIDDLLAAEETDKWAPLFVVEVAVIVVILLAILGVLICLI